ncbi:fibronectin type III domain-containing protein, partial [Fulvivirga kasyanovii]
VDAFGDEGEPSSSISGMGAAPVNTRAVLTNGLVVNNGESVKLQWTFPDEDEGMIKGFSIERSISTKGPYKSINSDLLQANERMYIDGFPNTTNYYQIVTFGAKGEVKRSHPILVQLQDSIPPDTPMGLIGFIDSTGVVTMKWQANTEQDLLGYRVYRSNFQSSEFSRVTASHLSSAIFYDTINIKTLTKDIYYKVSAIDNRFNESVISESYVIRKPDIVKPVLPVFKSLKSGNDGVNISWINSSSSDVVKHVLYRKKEGNNDWQYVEQFQLEIQDYKDMELVDSGKYSYTLVAVDKSGNESEPAKPLIVNVAGRELYNSDVFGKIYINKSKDNQAIFLKWKAGVGAKRILIFRGMADQQVTLYKSIEGSLTSFNDSSVLKEIVYKYRIQAEFSDGSRSLMSDEVSLEF